IEAWARLLTGYCTDVRAGQTVAIQGGTPAEPLLRAVYREVVARGAHPVMLPALPGLSDELLATGSDDQLEWISPLERFTREVADRSFAVPARTNTRAAAGVDP